VLKSVAHCGLLAILDIVVDLEGSRPRETGKFEDPGITTTNVSRQGRA
jgi:hypothetical protein